MALLHKQKFILDISTWGMGGGGGVERKGLTLPYPVILRQVARISQIKQFHSKFPHDQLSVGL